MRLGNNLEVIHLCYNPTKHIANSISQQGTLSRDVRRGFYAVAGTGSATGDPNPGFRMSKDKIQAGGCAYIRKQGVIIICALCWCAVQGYVLQASILMNKTRLIQQNTIPAVP